VRENKVYLLPVDADPDDPAAGLPIELVLEIVGTCKAPKLLILDLAHPVVDPMLGVLSDRVAEILAKQPRNNVPPFYVLCPCSAGQLSLTSEVLQSSVLAYYLDKGLQGAADGWGRAGKKDNVIMVDELLAFVEAQVDRWAQLNRLQRQRPFLLRRGEDFSL